jgi:ATP-dependent Clp protease ATP-binding subunit ClpC
MNPDYTFDSHALRVKLAKLSRFLRKSRLLALEFVCLAVTSFGIALLLLDVKIGYLLFVFAVIIGMVLIWNRWYLQNLPARFDTATIASGKLEQMLAADAAANMLWPASPQQLWQSLSPTWHVRFFVVRFGLDPASIETMLSKDQAHGQIVMQQAIQLSQKLGVNRLPAGAIVTALIITEPSLDAYLASLRIDKEDIISGLRWLGRIERIIEKLSNKSHFGGLARDWTAGYTPLLNQLGYNISREIQSTASYHGETDIRDDVINQIISVLAAPGGNSLALVGETGVGKTLTVYALAERLLKGESPSLRYHQVIRLDASAILAIQAGSLEQLLLKTVSEAVHAKNIILFLDEAQQFFSGGVGAVDISQLLLPILQHRQIRIIMSFTSNDWQKLKAANNSLIANLKYQALNEPDEAQTIHILQDHALLIENETIAQNNKVRITYQALQEAYRLSGRYITDLASPGRAITLLKSSVQHAQNGLVTALSVQQSVEATYGVKLTQAGGDEREKLLNLEDRLHQRMVNQVRAVKVVADALRRARAGVSNQNRPIGTFLFLGPTGVGKTELSKALADVYFGGRDRIIRIDMTEYSSSFDSKRLLESASRGNTPTFLTQVRTQPFSVVLFDEIEKAHPDILNLFLQLLDEGRLTDSDNKPVSFKDAIIIATSNAGADEIRQRIEAGQALEEFEEAFTNSLIDTHEFRPEFLNRFDEIVLFRPLTPEELLQVGTLMVEEVNQTLQPQKIHIRLSDEALSWLVQQGYDPRLGSRPMRRTIQRTVENVIAKRMLEGAIQPGQEVLLDAADLQAE